MTAHILAQSTPVTDLIQSQINNAHIGRRHSLVKQLSALRYLLRQGISVRNDHSGGSNLN
jgi:hypothetical protein